MKRPAMLFLSGLVWLSSLTVVSAESVKPMDEDLAGYVLVWSDEFAGPRLDLSKWNYRTDSKLWSNQLPQNISVANGPLKIALKNNNEQVVMRAIGFFEMGNGVSTMLEPFAGSLIKVANKGPSSARRLAARDEAAGKMFGCWPATAVRNGKFRAP